MPANNPTRPNKIINLLLYGNQLKRTPRTGWVQRGVVNAENVAAHSYGVAYTALVMADLINEPIDLGKLLAIAILHDLPEGLTTDIPSPAWRFLPAGIKSNVERQAMAEILAGQPNETQIMAFWEELHAAETIEAQLVHDADKIDMFLQALVYEQQTGNQKLEEFWAGAKPFRTPLAQEIFAELCRQRQQ